VEIAGQGFVGSVDAVAAGAVDLVMANISPEAIVALAADLLRVRKRDGVLLASGFEAHEVEQVRAALPEAREVRHKGKWRSWWCEGAGLSDNEARFASLEGMKNGRLLEAGAACIRGAAFQAATSASLPTFEKCR